MAPKTPGKTTFKYLAGAPVPPSPRRVCTVESRTRFSLAAEFRADPLGHGHETSGTLSKKTRVDGHIMRGPFGQLGHRPPLDWCRRHGRNSGTSTATTR